MTMKQRGGDVFVIRRFGWSVRCAVFYGDPPGSHIGVWRTHWGDLRGINVRIGKRYIGPCLTLMLHCKPLAGPVGVQP